MTLKEKLYRIDHLNPDRKDWDEDILEKIKIDFTYYSNKIEGNALNYGETIQLLKKGIQPKNGSIADIYQIEQHKKFLDHLFKSYNKPFTSEYIQGLHKIYMKNILQWAHGTGDNYSPGKLKWDNNGTMRSDGSIHIYVDHKETKNELDKLCQSVNLNVSAQQLHGIEAAAYFHQRFMEIHPFVDGNGRIGRMLTNQVLMKHRLSPIDFQKGIQKEQYIEMLANADSKEKETLISSYHFFADNQLSILEMKSQRPS